MNIISDCDVNSTDLATGKRAQNAMVLGSFKPPHGNDLYVVRKLLERSDVDKILIFISARAKLIPGSTQVMDANSSARLWRAMLGDEPRVQVRLAPDRATNHTNRLMMNTRENTEHLVRQRQRNPHDSGIQIDRIEEQLTVASNAQIKFLSVLLDESRVREAQLSQLLARGRKTRTPYVSMLRETIPKIENKQLWELRHSEPRDIHLATQIKLLPLHHKLNIAPNSELIPTTSTSRCIEFNADTVDGKKVRLKYVGDEVESSGKLAHAYPSNRLASANHCLTWLETQHDDARWFPRVFFYDESVRLLVETQPATDSHSLMSAFIAGTFDVDIGAQLGEVVAKLHRTPISKKPVRGSWSSETSWWKQRKEYWRERLDLRTLEYNPDYGDENMDRCIVHLNLVPDNVTVHNGQVVLSAFECASSVGDPAIDVVVVLSNYLMSGAATGRVADAERAARSFTDSYQKSMPSWGASCVRRAWRLL